MIRDAKISAVAFFLVAVLIAATGLFPGSPMMIPSTMSAGDIAQNYTLHKTSILWFSVLMGLSCLLWGFYVAVISVAMLRMKPRSFFLIFMHLMFGLTAVLSPFFGTVFFTAAAMMPNLSPDSIAAVHGIGRFFLLGSIFTLFSSIPLAIAIYRDRSERPILPKWFAHMNIIYAVAVQTNVIAVFFPPSSKFGLDGSIGMFLPLVLVEAFTVLTAVAMYRINPTLWYEADTLDQP